MLRFGYEFYRRVVTGEQPTIYITVTTHAGIRVFAEKQLNDHFDIASLLLDGSFLLGGSVTLGSMTEYMASKEPLLIAYDNIQRTMAPRKKDLLSGYMSKQQSSFTAVLNNADKALGKLMANEPFITRPLVVYLGYDEIPYSDHVKLFSGVINEIFVDNMSLRLTAVEN